MKKLNVIVVSVLVLICASSCLKNQQDYFGKPAAQRMTEFLDNAKNVIFHPSQGYGWRIEYFTDFGGYNMALDFKEDGSVTVWSERSPLKSETTLYRFASDDGPVLSFDTYNTIFHFFATPSSSEYQARGGDFEFIIISATPEKVVLKGKRSGYISTMYPLDKPAEEFVAESAQFAKNFLLLKFVGEIGKENYTGIVDLTSRTVTLAQYDSDGVPLGEEYSMGYIFVDGKMVLREPLAVNGEEFTFFKYDPQTRDVTCNNKSFFIASRIPADYTLFEKWPGEYSFTMNGSTAVDVTLSIYDDFEKIIECKGFGTYELFFYFDANKGYLNIPAQYIHNGEEICYDELRPHLPVCLFGIDSKGSGSTYYSMDIYRNGGTDEKPKYSFKSGTSTANVQYFSLYSYGDTDDAGWYSGTKWDPKQIKPNTLIKK